MPLVVADDLPDAILKGLPHDELLTLEPHGHLRFFELILCLQDLFDLAALTLKVGFEVCLKLLLELSLFAFKLAQLLLVIDLGVGTGLTDEITLLGDLCFKLVDSLLQRFVILVFLGNDGGPLALDPLEQAELAILLP